HARALRADADLVHTTVEDVGAVARRPHPEPDEVLRGRARPSDVLGGAGRVAAAHHGLHRLVVQAVGRAQLERPALAVAVRALRVAEGTKAVLGTLGVDRGDDLTLVAVEVASRHGM